MKALVKTSGQATMLAFMDVPRPEAGEDELLVRIRAIGVGIHDEYFHAQDIRYPYVIGIEAAGIVEEVGANVTGYRAGDRIAFISMMQPKGGTWAEYAVISKNSLILPVPDTMTFEQAAAFPVVGNTVLKALIGAGLHAGETLFVAGGAGALGSMLIQLAVASGYTVVASASKQNHEFMKSLGATQVVDYHDPDWQAQVRTMYPAGVDAAIAIHPGTPAGVQPVVKDGGVLVAVSGDTVATERGIVLKGVYNDIDVSRELADLLAQVADGRITQTISNAYAFADALSALNQVQTRHTRGKLVLSVPHSEH
jgi:NADPH:quinone reductase-like Zn-dependent oxidoreductase